MKTSARLILAVLLGAGWTAAWAHTGHGTQSLWAGMAHPLALDHLMAMVAVGMWSAAAFTRNLRVVGPVVFMLGLLGGAGLAWVLAVGPVGTAVEVAIATSLVLLASMLCAPRAWPAPLGLGLVAAAAVLHGLAHGAELPAGAGFAGYAAGFLLTTALLHGLGLVTGQAMARAQVWVWRAVAALLGGTGILLAWV